MEREWKFDKEYLKEKIKEGEILLRKDNVDDNIKLEIDSMLSNFYDYLGVTHLYSSNKKPNLSLDEIYISLTNKLNRDLKRLNLELWKSMHDLCWTCEKASFLTSNTHKLHLSPNIIVDEALKFYKKIDKEFYIGAKQIIYNPVKLINFSDKKSLGDHCFECDYLDLPFVNIYQENDLSLIWFVHELQHGIDFLLYKNVPYLFSEVSSIFSETLYIDMLLEKRIKDIDVKRLYSYRVHSNNDDMKNMYNYIELLYRFIENGLEINKDNIGKILCCDSEKSIQEKYKYLRLRNYLEMYSYILSFFRSIELREIYYNDRKKALSQLKNVLMGGNENVDFDKLRCVYGNYINEIKDKYKVKKRW